MQKAQIDALERIQSHSVAGSIPPPPRSQGHALRIAKDGQDLGEIDISQIRLMLVNGELDYQDYYFDRKSNEWVAIEFNPEFIK